VGGFLGAAGLLYMVRDSGPWHTVHEHTVRASGPAHPVRRIRPV